MSAPLNLGAMARMRAAMARLKPTPGDAKSDLLVVIASRLIMNSGNPVRISDVLNASSCAPADAWVARAFGKDVRLTAEMVETALSRAKDHFQRAKDGRFVMKGWPLARRLECRVNEDWGAEWRPDPRLGITLRDLKPDRVPLAKRSREAQDANAAGAPAAHPADGRGEPREVVDVCEQGAKATAANAKKRAAASPAPRQKSKGAAPSNDGRTTSKKGTAKPAAEAKARRKPFRKRKLGTEEELDETDDDNDDDAAAALGTRKDDGPVKDPVAPTHATNATNATNDPAAPIVDPGDTVASEIRFFGAARGSDVHRHRTYYDGFEVLTRKGSEVIEAKYVTGDLVYCLPGAEDEAMYLAQIESVFEDPNGQWVDCAWLERGSDLRALVPSDEVWREVAALDEEVFLTLAVNTNPVQTIEGKCRVVTEAQWAGERAEEGKRKKAPARQETFVCRRALIGAPPGEKKKKPSGKAADSWAKAAVAGMFAPVTFEQGVGFRAVLPSANKGKAKKGKGKR